MGTTTQFDRVFVGTHGEHPHYITVLLTKQSHRAFFLGGIHIGNVDIYRRVLQNLLVNRTLDFSQLLRSHGFKMGEVESQFVRVDQRALLGNVLAQNIAQRRVQQVRGRVVALGTFTAGMINPRIYFQAGEQLTLNQGADMQVVIPFFAGVGYLEAATAPGQQAGITHLATGLRVERRALQYHHTLITSFRVTLFAVDQHRADTFMAIDVVITGKLGLALDRDAGGIVVDTKLAGGTSPIALGLHGFFVAFVIQSQATLAGNIVGQIDREPVGVVKSKHGFTGNLGTLQLRNVLLQQAQAFVQGLGELLFLLQQHLFDLLAATHQLRIGLAHQLNQSPGKLVEKRLGSTELVAVASCAANDSAQNKAAPFVGRHHAVGNQEGARTDMIRHHAQRRFCGGRTTQDVGCRLQQVLEQVDFIVAVNTLQNRSNPLQPHASVHRGFGQVQHLAVGGAVVLHEDHVPDLDVAVAVFFRAARGATRHIRAVVVENLGARATGPGITHLPEVIGCVAGAFVVANAHNPFRRYTDFLIPDIKGFVVFGVNRYPQLLLGQVEVLFASQEGPGEIDSLALEVIAEAEVAKHLEEGMVARRIAHVFQIIVLAAGTHAFLGTGRSCIVALLAAEEKILELVHPRVGKQQSGIIVGYQ